MGDQKLKIIDGVKDYFFCMFPYWILLILYIVTEILKIHRYIYFALIPISIVMWGVLLYAYKKRKIGYTIAKRSFRNFITIMLLCYIKTLFIFGNLMKVYEVQCIAKQMNECWEIWFSVVLGISSCFWWNKILFNSFRRAFLKVMGFDK